LPQIDILKCNYFLKLFVVIFSNTKRQFYKKMKIAIASGKGGTGKTFISTNLFYALQKNKYNVTLVDCDAEEPNDLIFFDVQANNSFDVTQKNPVIDEQNCFFCGRCYTYCNYNAIFYLPEQKIIKVIDDLCHACGACNVACRKNAITYKTVTLGKISEYEFFQNSKIIEARMNVGVYSPVSIIKEAIKKANNQEVVILDSPPGTSCPFIQTVNKADFVILVTEPTPFGLSDLKQSVETLKTMNKPIGVIINRSGLGNNDIYQYLNDEKIPLLMQIPFDKKIATIYSNGELVARHNILFESELMSIVKNLITNYGNSSN